MTRRPDIDDLNAITKLINNGHSPPFICKSLGCSSAALMRRISRNASFIISRLSSAKYSTLLLFIEKGRSTNSIALSLDLPETLINSAKKLVKQDEYPNLHPVKLR
jgi:hypothetical protein